MSGPTLLYHFVQKTFLYHNTSFKLNAISVQVILNGAKQQEIEIQFENVNLLKKIFNGNG